ncbi:MAG: hypothetical protein H0U66_02005 [Gemmatimonadaceae bacterium]|nr:hypothetical protein [Gemmatimonadaceae bacterium]
MNCLASCGVRRTGGLSLPETARDTERLALRLERGTTALLDRLATSRGTTRSGLVASLVRAAAGSGDNGGRMSIIDEEWRQSEAYPADVFEAGERGEMLFEGRGDHNDEAACARARLIAQAPAMARLLLARIDDCGGWCERGGGHKPDCRLVAVLRAAGVVD